ncbi:MAG: sigma 54-interacting transcriptional regulator [Bacteriovoracaceae bacterium]|nr:sigma 54-interacting transcriptional regulator [Bacteriovoracaceae bacterium]
MAIQISEYQQLLSNGIRLGDTLKITPFSGKKKEIELSRTNYIFHSDDLNLKPNYYAKIEFSSYLSKTFNFHLKLLVGKSQCQNTGRFQLKSSGDCPFKLNGSMVYSAFIERGDIVEIEDNILEFNMLNMKSSDSFCEQFNRYVFSPLPIVIEGETGTGKSYLAKKIYETTKPKGKFVHLNLSSFSTSLVESEIFGHVKGAFTGAIQDKIGAFREAEEGILFLDEIDSISLELQAKLLLTLETSQVRPVGGSREYQINTRIIYGSGRRLHHLMGEKKMRADFYFRITAGAKINLKPLRDDTEKIKSFCHRVCSSLDVSISPELLEFYTTLPWPGNYRQLKSHLELKKYQTNGRKLEFDDEDERLLVSSSELESLFEDQMMISMERCRVIYAHKVYLRFKGDLNKACCALEISKATLKTLLSKNSLA